MEFSLLILACATFAVLLGVIGFLIWMCSDLVSELRMMKIAKNDPPQAGRIQSANERHKASRIMNEIEMARAARMKAEKIAAASGKILNPLRQKYSSSESWKEEN